MKKIIAILTVVILAIATLVSCADRDNRLSGYREGLYFEFEASGSDMYEVRYRRIDASLATFFTGSNESWSQPIDSQLIRFYEDDIVRFDILGLTPGLYEVQIIGIDETFGTPTGFEKLAGPINVYQHSRVGFAFFNQDTNKLDLNLASGAYYPDGRLRTNANVLYIYDENIDVVEVEINNRTYVGLHAISNAIQHSNEPWNIRIIGKVTSPVVHTLGEIVFSNVNTGLTIEGVGNDAVIYGWQIGINRSTNVEIRNLAFKMSASVEGDSLNINDFNTHIHIHNNEFFYADTHSLTGSPRNTNSHFKGDGSTDFVRTTNVTLGYNIYWDTGKTMLIGNTPDRLYHTDFFTVHSNWFNHSDTRHPRVRAASTVHVFNNFYDGVSGAGIGSTFGATVISENNYFLNTNRPFVISNQGNDATGSHLSNEPGGFIASLNDIIRTDRPFHNQQNHWNPTLKDYNYLGFFPQWDALKLNDRNSNVSNEIRVNSTVNDDHHNNPETGSSRYFNNFHIELADVMPTARPANQVPDYVRANAGRIGRTFEFDFPDSAIFAGGQHRNAELDYFLRNYSSSLIQVGFGYNWPQPPYARVPVIEETPPLPETALVQTLWLTGDGTVPGRQELNVYLSHPSVHTQGTNVQAFNPNFRTIADATRPFACNDSHRVPLTIPSDYIQGTGPDHLYGSREITHGLRFPVGNGFEITLTENMYVVLFFSRIHGAIYDPNINEVIPPAGTSRLYMNNEREVDNIRPNTLIPAGDGVFNIAKIILELEPGTHMIHRPASGMNEITFLMMMFFER